MANNLSIEAGTLAYPFISFEEEFPYLYTVCDKIVYITSAISILEELGYKQYANELKLSLKYWVSELVVKLATQKYIDGLASELSCTVKPLWSLRLSDEELKLYLYRLLNFGIAVKGGMASREEAKEVLLDFIEIFEVDLSKSPRVRKVLEEVYPQLVLQTVLTGLITSVKGLSGGSHIV
ncbi:MAG: hypothetical protein J7L12_05255 [Desulfurococcales archaeon]|nr:hypothetical protein [Desulfurococcales archaeon]